MPSVEAKFASIGMVLIKGNKWAFRRPLEKVRITTYDTSQTTMVGEREKDTCTHTHTGIDTKIIIQTRKNILLLLL